MLCEDEPLNNLYYHNHQTKQKHSKTMCIFNGIYYIFLGIASDQQCFTVNYKLGMMKS